MSDLVIPDNVLFFGSFLFRSDLIEFSQIEKIWSSKFSNSLFFTHTFFPMREFYSKEMGGEHSLKRIILVSTTPEKRDHLSTLKHWAIEIELQHSFTTGKRKINLDIGYISLENTVLATGKNFSHRIHLQSGVFAELTYFYEAKSFRAFPWTYPDYSHLDYLNFFNFSRSLLQKKTKEKLS